MSLFQPANLFDFQTCMLLLPAIKSLLRNPRLTYQLCHRPPLPPVSKPLKPVPPKIFSASWENLLCNRWILLETNSQSGSITPGRSTLVRVRKGPKRPKQPRVLTQEKSWAVYLCLHWPGAGHRITYLRSHVPVVARRGGDKICVQKEFMRHANIATTMNTYGQALSRDKVMTSKKIGRMLLRGIQP